MPLQYEHKIRLTIIEPDRTETVHFLRGNMQVAAVLQSLGYKKARHKGHLLSGEELLKELADEYGVTLHVR